MNKVVSMDTPLRKNDIRLLKAGQEVSLNGFIYTARDAAHKKMYETLKRGGKLPFNPEGQVIYYCGPTPVPPGKISGSAGPTTSCRMDAFTPSLLAAGLKGMIGKGKRSEEVSKSIVKYGAIYFVAVGGAGALLSQKIDAIEVISYPELGPEAVYRLAVKDFPVFVGIDIHGNSIYK